MMDKDLQGNKFVCHLLVGKVRDESSLPVTRSVRNGKKISWRITC